jgi:hypothetical protein
MPAVPGRAATRWKGSKTRDACSGSIPMPVSRTTTSTHSWSGEITTSTRPPAGVYLTALWSRLAKSW